MYRCIGGILGRILSSSNSPPPNPKISLFSCVYIVEELEAASGVSCEDSDMGLGRTGDGPEPGRWGGSICAMGPLLTPTTGGPKL